MKFAVLFVCCWVLAPGAARAEGLLGQFHRQSLLSPTVPENGDQNPYAVIVAPVGAGSVRKNDVLITNFNDQNNLQGLGTTIVDYRPDTGALTTFATVPRHLAGCPGGVGLGTALAMLRSGWVVVGSTPSADGRPTSKGAGCLIVLDPAGAVAEVIATPQIDGPWGNMAVIDRGDRATLFVSNAGFGVGGTAPQALVRRATVLRLELSIGAGAKPVVTAQTVIAGGFGAQADPSVFLIGPTGLALGADGILYVSDAIGNRITAIDAASTRTDSAGTGRQITRDGLLQRPLAMAMTPAGTLLVTNGLNGQMVEIDPRTGRQLGAIWLDANRAQSPPGSGDLFGFALTPGGDGIYFVEDEINSLMLAH